MVKKVTSLLLSAALFLGSTALPGGIAAALCAAAAMAMSGAGWDGSTLAVLSAGTICWLVLLRTCMPLNRIRIALGIVHRQLHQPCTWRKKVDP